MKRVSSTLIGLVVLAVMFCFIGVIPVSATRAETSKDTGCYVRVGEGDDDYAFDSTCTAHAVLNFDNDGNFDF